nr:hypothetical protein L204_04237 [Cryptococcus depauperatus CBS 7855]
MPLALIQDFEATVHERPISDVENCKVFQLMVTLLSIWMKQACGIMYDAEAKHFLLTTSDLNVENFAGTDTKAEAEKPKCHDLPIGVIRYVSSKQKLTRLAILPAYRNLGLSRVLVQGLEEYVKNSLQGKEVNWFNIRCHSQLQAIPIYEKLGYVKEGAEFDEEGGQS